MTKADLIEKVANDNDISKALAEKLAEHLRQPNPRHQ